MRVYRHQAGPLRGEWHDTVRTVTGSVACTNSEFGDPLFGVVKHCDVADPTCSPGQKIGNSDFENGIDPWVRDNGVIGQVSAQAHSGTRAAWLTANGSPLVRGVYQTVTIPAGCTDSKLSFWLKVTTNEDWNFEYDTLTVKLGRAVLARYSNLDAGSYELHTIDVGKFAGQTVTLNFTSTFDEINPTMFFIDDVTLNAS